MALPNASDARPYYQAAKQRLSDARFLLDAERTTGAIYLAGYGIECMLKALILASQAKRQRTETLRLFRGPKAHDFVWLKKQYSRIGGPPISKSILRTLTLVSVWTVEIRYKASSSKFGDAKEFLDYAQEIVSWADERM